MRIANLTPVEQPDGKWMLNVPPGMSSNGRRRRLYFKSEAEAKAEVTRLRRIRREYGTRAVVLPEELATMAKRADEMLEPYDASIMEAVKFFISHREAQAASVKFDELWAAHTKLLEANSASPSYLRAVKFLGKKLSPAIGRKLVSGLDHEDIEKALSHLFKTATWFNNSLRTLSPAFSLAVEKGWAKANPCKKVRRRKNPKAGGEVDVLGIGEATALLAACKDYRKDGDMPALLRQDTRGCAHVVATLLFAGVRPEEVTRLAWSDIRFDHNVIRVPGRKSKTGHVRLIPIEPNLLLWLEQVPEGKRGGPFCPQGWRRKWQTIRKATGLERRQDVCRHSYASYWLAAYEDVNALRERMGHRTNDILHNHYRAGVLKADALKYWGIVPSGEEVPKTIKPAAEAGKERVPRRLKAVKAAAGQ